MIRITHYENSQICTRATARTLQIQKDLKENYQQNSIRDELKKGDELLKIFM